MSLRGAIVAGALATAGCGIAHGCAVVYDFDDYEVAASGAGAQASASSGEAGGAGGAGASGGSGGCGDPSSNPEHCGACGHDCLGGDCVEGRCQPVVLAQGSSVDGSAPNFGTVSGIALDETWVYYGDRGDQNGNLVGGILRVPKAGGSPAEVLVGSGTVAGEIALDAGRVYWVSWDDQTVNSVPKTGGAFEQLASGQPGPGGIAVQGELVFFTADQFAKVIFDGGGVDALGPANGASSITADSDAVYWANGNGDGSILRLPLPLMQSYEPIPLATGQTSPRALAVDDENAYWAIADGTILRAPKTSGGEVEGIAQGDVGVTSIALDATYVYWVTWGDCVQAACAHGTVNRAPKDGGAATILHEGNFLAADVAVDDDAIYWTNWWFTMVMKLAK